MIKFLLWLILTVICWPVGLLVAACYLVWQFLAGIVDILGLFFSGLLRIIGR